MNKLIDTQYFQACYIDETGCIYFVSKLNRFLVDYIFSFQIRLLLLYRYISILKKDILYHVRQKKGLCNSKFLISTALGRIIHEQLSLFRIFLGCLVEGSPEILNRVKCATLNHDARTHARSWTCRRSSHVQRTSSGGNT